MCGQSYRAPLKAANKIFTKCQKCKKIEPLADLRHHCLLKNHSPSFWLMLSAWKADQSKRKYRTQPMQCENQKPVLCWIFWPLIEDDLLPRWRQNRACLANEDGDIKKKTKTYFYIWCLCQLLNVDQRRCHTPCHVIQGLQLQGKTKTVLKNLHNQKFTSSKLLGIERRVLTTVAL